MDRALAVDGRVGSPRRFVTARRFLDERGVLLGLAVVALVFGVLIGPQFFAATNLELMARQDGYARVFLVDVYAAGERALVRRREVIDRFTDVVAELVGARTAADRFACEALVAAVSSLVTVRVAAGDLDEIPKLRRPIMEVARRLLAGSSLG